MGTVGFELKRSSIDPGHLTCPAVHFPIHVRGAAGTVAPTPVPETDELDLADAI